MRNLLSLHINLPLLHRSMLCMLITFMGFSFANAATVSYKAFSVDVPDDWDHSVEAPRSNSQGFGSIVRIVQPEGRGELSIMSYDSPVLVDEAVLRNFTNVDTSIQLILEQWGDFAGYHYSYSEGGTNFRQWWLSNRTTLLFLVYQNDRQISAEDIETIDTIVESLVDVTDEP